MKIRCAQRDERREELVKARQAEDILRGQLEDLQREVRNLQVDLRVSSQPGEIDVNKLLEKHRHELIVRTQSQQLAQQLQQVAEETERRRQVLVEADRQVQVLEKLKERQHEQYREAEKKLDIKLMDEIAGQQHQRKSRTAS